ncbi:hypothetical protein JVU11DRAFT_6502 [Chiua virens]|nr:hypothetical protein JVU11DRAFT_6502 [Chiua virens]
MSGSFSKLGHTPRRVRLLTVNTMDQDAFRSLLASERQSQPSASTSAKISSQKATTPVLSGPSFKPRKVKKTEGKYRDRAAERRDGIGNDYAEVEAVLEDFEKRVVHEDKDVIEEQRKYLGGDGQHTILVKGLDVSLFEQNRARAAASTEDDDILEQAFAQATSTSEPTEPKKRTREEIIRNLKAKQQNEDKPADETDVQKSMEDVSTLEAAKKAGKFKPIGQAEEKMKKRKVKNGEVVKKKKRKVESAPEQARANSKQGVDTPAIPESQKHDVAQPSSSTKSVNNPPESEPIPLDEDFDIFLGVGEYEGFPDDEESESEVHRTVEETRAASVLQKVPAVGGWFAEPEPEVEDAFILPAKSPSIPEVTITEEQPQEVRLKPLESSALPSIRDFLAMDEAAGKAGKRKARKEKKKRKKAGGDDDDD